MFDMPVDEDLLDMDVTFHSDAGVMQLFHSHREAISYIDGECRIDVVSMQSLVKLKSCWR